MGKANKPFEFGVKVSVATPLNRYQGGQFVDHIKALPGNLYGGDMLATVIPALERTIRAELERIIVEDGYKGHHAPEEKRFGSMWRGRTGGSWPSSSVPCVVARRSSR